MEGAGFIFMLAAANCIKNIIQLQIAIENPINFAQFLIYSAFAALFSHP